VSNLDISYDDYYIATFFFFFKEIMEIVEDMSNNFPPSFLTIIDLTNFNDKRKLEAET
jgi:hypothetical protein